MTTTYKPSAAEVKTLREMTQAGMSDCLKALAENNGDMEKSKDWLRAKGLSAASKRLDREAKAGLVLSATSADGRVGSLVEVNSETDFVAKNDLFSGFVKELATLVVNETPTGIDDPINPNVPGESLMNLNWAGNPQENVETRLKSLIGTLGENMVIRRFARFDLADTPGLLVNYIHLGGKVGVLVELTASSAEVAAKPEAAEIGRDLAMHIAAASPEFVKAEDITEEAVARERAIAEQKTREEGKPEHVMAGIIEGRLKKWRSEVVLLEQAFVKDDKKNVDGFLKESGKALGGELQVRRFARFAIGS
ncbi:MAG: translation elongation factor Ts [bacterium]